MLDNRQTMTDLLDMIDKAIAKADELEQYSVAATLAHAQENIRQQMLSNIC